MIRKYKIWVKSNTNVSNCKFGKCYYMMALFCSKTSFKGVAPISEVKEGLLRIRFDIVHRYEECA